MDLRKTDLNLLIALQVLLDEGNVTRAAARLAITQPAMSRTLSRLRVLFDDPLFVRNAHGVTPTPRAEALRERLGALLADVSGLIAPTSFVAATANDTFRIATTDYGANSMLPLLLNRLHEEAPMVNLELIHWQNDGFWLLEHGQAHLALASVSEAPAGIHGRGLGDDSFVCLLRRDHPMQRGKMAGDPIALDDFVALPQILIDVGGGEARGVVDFALEALGRQRRVAVRLPHFMAAMAMVARTDMIVTVPHTLARLYADAAGLVERKLPFVSIGVRYALLWHERSHRDPGHLWLRTLFYEEIVRALHAIAPADGAGVSRPG